MAAGPADKALDTFKSLVFDPLVKKVVAKVLGLATFLSWGPLAFIVTKIIEKVADFLYEELSDVINFKVIMLQNELHHAAYVKAALELKGLAKDKGVNSPEFQRARDAHKTALNKFVRYSGT